MDILFIYVGRAWRFLRLIEIVLSFSKSSLNMEVLLQYVIHKALSCNTFVFYLSFYYGMSTEEVSN